jgi:ADP-ribosylglycohydrolase
VNTTALNRQSRTVNSALWAAYGDAIGFTTELADASLVKRRTGSAGPVTTTVAWQRLVGGRFGALVDLPAGTYSDDTQLRLATSRCIRQDGYFDVESLAKIELPVWLNYSLGGGLGSKAAATSLSSSSTNWYSNFFRTEKATYVQGGGNGAAMRVQPHVWCAGDLMNPNSYLPDVVRNAVVTHGHVRGIAGAMLHAMSLAFVLGENRIPAPDEWQNFSSAIAHLPMLVEEDRDLKTFWLPTWEAESGTSIDIAARAVADEWKQACEDAARRSLTGKQDYIKLVESLGGLQPDQRGSGLKTALFSLAAAWAMRSQETSEVLESIANVLASDTDTIATMSGALLGALPNQPEPLADIQDKQYIIDDARRLCAISSRSAADDFVYPDLLYWQPPKSSLDALGVTENFFALHGLGEVEPLGKIIPARQGEICYQWFRLKSGQTLLCKRRTEPRFMPATSLPQPRVATSNEKKNLSQQPTDQDLFGHRRAPRTVDRSRDHAALTLDAATDEAIRSNFNATVVGNHLLMFAESEDGLELTVAYAAIVVKARRARLKKGAVAR